ncbi:unknown protein [Desulfotalea psychrophila LSv54]|uniref:Uncharacterized protein n=1 Tax=Desulfotalea psychrophila (strain LSv54 / DSM 12343) TaxID=177439 RepID=Q6AKU4_DESPS|nr:unknown protein [Desulfotalea psychrophila LSv54]
MPCHYNGLSWLNGLLYPMDDTETLFYVCCLILGYMGMGSMEQNCYIRRHILLYRHWKITITRMNDSTVILFFKGRHSRSNSCVGVIYINKIITWKILII